MTTQPLDNEQIPTQGRFKTWHKISIAIVASLAVGAVAGWGATAASMQPQISTATENYTSLKADHDSLQEDYDEISSERTAIINEYTDKLAEQLEVDVELTDRAAALDERESELVERETAVGVAEKKAAENSFSNGVHRVGADIKAGTYRNDGSGSCYWARLSGGSGQFSDILANGNPDGPATVTISGSDWGFESSRCGTWTKVD